MKTYAWIAFCFAYFFVGLLCGVLLMRRRYAAIPKSIEAWALEREREFYKACGKV